MTLTSLDRYSTAAQEDRCAPRVRLEIPAQLRPSGSHAFACTISDLSLGGFAVRAVTGMPTGTICWLSVGALRGLQAKVVWNDGQSLGCEFQTLLNPAVFDSVVNGR